MSTGLPRPSECNGCHEPIRFVKLNTGKALPVNPAPNPQGNVAAGLRGGRLHGFVICRDHLPGPLESYRFTAHYATCEAIERKPTKPKPEPHPALFDA